MIIIQILLIITCYGWSLYCCYRIGKLKQQSKTLKVLSSQLSKMTTHQELEFSNEIFESLK